MRITLVSETFFPQVNGVSRTLDRLVGHLISSGDQVQLIVPRYKQKAADQYGPNIERNSVTAMALPFYRDVLIACARKKWLRRRMEMFKPDLVHIATEGPLGLNALRACRTMNLPLVSSFHTNFPSYASHYGASMLEPALWRYLRWFHNSGQATLCPTRSISELLQTQAFRNVQVWGRGVDSTRFCPDKRSDETRDRFGIGHSEIVILYAGRLAAEKNLGMLVNAVQALNRRIPARLLLVGDGPLRAKLESSDGGTTIFTGYRHGEELSQLYAAADVFAFPSITDTFGNVILEAMASGVPAVGFDVPGPRDIIRHGETGLIAPAISAEAMTSALHTALNDRTELRRLSINARQYALSQTWDCANSVVRKVYAEVLQQMHP